MSTDEPTGEATAAASADPTDSDRPAATSGPRSAASPAAAAASRARRMGGAAPRTRRTSEAPVQLDKGEPDDELTAVGDMADEESEGESAAASPAVRTEIPVWLRWAPAAVLVAAALTFAVLIAVVGHGVWYAKPGANEVRDKVLAAAKRCTVVTNTYKYTNIDAFEKAGLACTTGIYTKNFRTAVDTLIKKNAPRLKFTQTAQINEAGVEALTRDGSQWTVLVYGQLSITNTQTGKNGRIDPFAAVVRMDNVNAHWLISKIDPVSSPSG